MRESEEKYTPRYFRALPRVNPQSLSCGFIGWAANASAYLQQVNLGPTVPSAEVGCTIIAAKVGPLFRRRQQACPIRIPFTFPNAILWVSGYRTKEGPLML
jgi:hypothetical protein